MECRLDVNIRGGNTPRGVSSSIGFVAQQSRKGEPIHGLMITLSKCNEEGGGTSSMEVFIPRQELSYSEWIQAWEADDFQQAEQKAPEFIVEVCGKKNQYGNSAELTLLCIRGDVVEDDIKTEVDDDELIRFFFT